MIVQFDHQFIISFSHTLRLDLSIFDHTKYQNIHKGSLIIIGLSLEEIGWKS